MTRQLHSHMPSLLRDLRRVGPIFSFAALLLFVCLGASASAVTISFDAITDNGVGSPAIGEAQLFVEALDVAGDASFRFYNTGPEDSNISEIYFDDGSLLGISTIFDNPPMVDYELGATPLNLPGGGTISPPFEVTEGFLAQAENPASMKGVDPGEEVTIMFDLTGGQTFQDVLGELANGTLRIGIHVIDFSGGFSESFVNDPIVPEPTSIALLSFGLAMATGLRRRC